MRKILVLLVSLLLILSVVYAEPLMKGKWRKDTAALVPSAGENIDIDGLAYIDGFGEGTDFGDFDILSLGKLEFFDSSLYIDGSVDGVLDVEADTTLNLGTGSTTVNIGYAGSPIVVSELIRSDTANTDDLGTEALYFRKPYFASEMSFEGTTDDASQTTFTITDPTGDRTITVPDANITLIGLAWENSTDVNSGAASPTTWTDLDLSGVVGSNEAFVVLRIKSASDMNETSVRRDGDTNEYYSEAADPNAYGCALGHHSSVADLVLMCMTDADGEIEWITQTSENANVYVQLYIK